MQLIGMLDSPYVRRVAISMQLMGLDFEHKAVSVFRHLDEFKKINPLVKAPTLICNNGSVLMDSTLILQYLDSVSDKPNCLMPDDTDKKQAALRQIGLALNVCDKSVQYYYEHNVRPKEKLYQPWVDRVLAQLQEAMNALEQEFDSDLGLIDGKGPSQVGISSAVAFKFARMVLPAETVDLCSYGQLVAWSEQMEARTEFKKAAFGDNTYPVGG